MRGGLLFAALCAPGAVLGAEEPVTELPEVVAPTFAAKGVATLCNVDGHIRLRALLGELMVRASINAFDLPPAPNAPGSPPSAEANTVQWLLASQNMSRDQAAQVGLRGDTLGKLTSIRIELGDYLAGLPAQPGPLPYWRASGAPVTITPNEGAAPAVAALFAPLLDPAQPAGLVVGCKVSTPAAETAGRAAPRPASGRVRWLVRGKIDDLAVPRFKPGETEVSDAFGKASDAKMGFTDNQVKHERAITADVVVGAGRQFTPNDALLGFAHLTQSSTETGMAGDDDDTKDVRAFSAGVLWRRSVGSANHSVFGTFGLTAYPTWDLAQDSRLVRARAFLSDVVLMPGDTPVCGAETLWFQRRLLATCRLSVFSEYGRVLEAGRSTDLATTADDDYWGVGGSIAFTLAWINPPALAPFSFTADFRYMHLIDRELDDPSRLTLELAYKIPKSNLSISLSRTLGENTETFQHEDVNKLSIGFKY